MLSGVGLSLLRGREVEASLLAVCAQELGTLRLRGTSPCEAATPAQDDTGTLSWLTRRISDILRRALSDFLTMSDLPPDAKGNAGLAFEKWFSAYSELLAATVLAVGFFLRIRAASGTFLNPDEALHFLAANQTSLAAAYRASVGTAHPPLLILVLYLLRSFGTSELALRLPSVIAGTVFCWVAFRWLTSLLGQVAGWIGLIFVTFLPPMIELSAEVRQYALLLCLSALAAYLLERAWAKNSAREMLISFLFLYLAMLTHFSAILFAGTLGGYSALRLVREPLSKGLLALWTTGQAGALALLVFLYQTHIAPVTRRELAQQSMQALLTKSYFHWGRDHIPLFIFARSFGVFQYVFGQLAIGDVAGLMFFAGVAMLLMGKYPPEMAWPRSRELGILLLLPFVLNCAAALVDLYPYGGTRHSAILAPFAIAGVSFVLARLTGQRIARGLAAALLVVVTCHLFGIPHRPYMLRRDQSRANMTSAMDFIHRQVSATDHIFVDFQSNYFLRYYLCRERTAPADAILDSFHTLQCGGYHVISTDYQTNIFNAEIFLIRWHEMLRLYALKPGDTVWVFQAGWDIHLADQLKGKYPELGDLNPQPSGRNITIFKLTVGQPLPTN
jgi:Dolichyl-phosphate-mannose-protein mannosyltransferase